MAGSVLPPLTNIPYCCLPQESGPCLSTSVGDRPLRSPSHRSLGGPSPRQQANGTHARPRPRRRVAAGRMPFPRNMPCYPRFPKAIRLTGVGRIRVTHPSATLIPPKGGLPYDLHVLGLPLAFILSQDQTLRCTIDFLLVSSVVLRSAFASFLIGSLSAWRAPHGVIPRHATVLASSYQRTSANPSPLPTHSFPCLRAAKIRPFSESASTFSKNFSSYTSSR